MSVLKLRKHKVNNSDDFWRRSKAAREVFANGMWEDEQQRLEAALTDQLDVVVDDEKYRRLSNQTSLVLIHGLWGRIVCANRCTGLSACTTGRHSDGCYVANRSMSSGATR